jgi:tetratricopeptide (TPR) repeat protein
MQQTRSIGRSVLVALSLLSACAAADPSAATVDEAASVPLTRREQDTAPQTGEAAALLAARFAASQGDIRYAADQFLKALAHNPDDADLRKQAFLSALLADRPEAADLARQDPDNPVAILLLADIEAIHGNWAAAEKRITSLPKEGLTQLLQPLLLAWVQFGAGHANAALGQLHPDIDNERIRAVYAFHDALIADLAGRNEDAARLYKAAQAGFGQANLDLVRALASWQARQGHPAAARQTLAAVNDMGEELAVSTPRLIASMSTRPVGSATQGLAAVYLAFAGLLRQQESGDYAAVMLRLALDLRPDFTEARLVAAEAIDSNKHPEAALAMLAPVEASDPLAPSVDMRRAALYDRIGSTDEALRTLAALTTAVPDRPEPWALQGAILRSQHRYAEAVTAYTRALSLMGPPSRQHWPLYYERGIAEERGHMWPAAEADFLKALDLSPNEPSVLNYLGYSWTEQGHNLPRAHDMIARAAQDRPNDGAIVDSLGWVQLRQGETAAAVKSLERASEMEPEDATINGHLGDAYWAAGRKLLAEYQWRRALTLNPEPEDAAHFQARLHEAEQQLGAPAKSAAAAVKTQP